MSNEIQTSFTRSCHTNGNVARGGRPDPNLGAPRLSAQAPIVQSKRKKTSDELIQEGVLPPRPTLKTYEELQELGICKKYPDLSPDAPKEYHEAPDLESLFMPNIVYRCEKRKWRETCEAILSEIKEDKRKAKAERKATRKEEKKAERKQRMIQEQVITQCLEIDTAGEIAGEVKESSLTGDVK
ncbi:unnamed protein product [Peniophora sp. CBMAI 1063]|nr:unnamed protein product [Peniophora sp. CBMAI 1063]